MNFFCVIALMYAILSKVLFICIYSVISIYVNEIQCLKNHAVFPDQFSYLTHEYLTNLSGIPGHGYYITSSVGTPFQQVNLLLDTGSSDLAIAIKALGNVDHWFNSTQSSSLTCTEYAQYVRYQQGSWSGQLCADKMQLDVIERKPHPIADEFTRVNLTFTTQIALIDTSHHFFLPAHNLTSWSGIAGLAFSSLSVNPIRIGKIGRQQNSLHPTNRWQRMWNRLLSMYQHRSGFWDSLVTYTNGVADMFSLLLCGLTQVSTENSQPQLMSGTLLLGTSNIGSGSRFPSQIFYTPIVKPWYYEIVLTDVLVEGESVVDICKELNFDKTIVDSGTTNIHLPPSVFDRLLTAIKRFVAIQIQSHGTIFDMTDDFWLGTASFCEAAMKTVVGGASGIPYILFPPIEIQMVSAIESSSKVLSVSLSPQQYLRYMGRFNRTGFVRDCFAFGIQASRTGTILGATFLEGFLTVFDRGRLKVGFGNSTCNQYTNHTGTSKINGLKPWRVTGKRGSVFRPLDCAFQRPIYTRFNDLISRLSLFVSLFTCLFILVSLPIISLC